LKGKLVVSCQAYPGDPLDDTDAIRRMALASVGAGASGLRLNSAEHIAAIRRHTGIPIIGIQKRYDAEGLRITPDFAAASALAAAGASMIALDCTRREWLSGDPWREIIQRVHRELQLPVMADVSTCEEALAAAAAEADCISTTLNGYTEETRGNQVFDWDLLARLRRQLEIPVMAEGHISTPAEARRAIDEGAWCVIVGSAITRPGEITAKYVKALRHVESSTPAIGVDIGGTSVKAALVERDGCVGFTAEARTTASEGRDAIASALVRAVEQVLAAVRKEGREPAGLGIATAGAVDQRDGSIFAATDNLPGWAGFPLRAFAEEQFKLPAFVVNDAQAAALSELHFGQGRNLCDFVSITIGTGVGGGVVSAGKLLRGEHGFGGTIGHHVIAVDGRACNCGRRGCLEAYVSTAALVREYRALNSSEAMTPGDDSELALKINQLARTGDRNAQQAYEILSRYLAEAVANLFNILDPEAVLISGGLIEGYSEFAPAVEAKVRRLLHFGVKREPHVYAARAGRFAGAQGAAALVFETDKY
jgi:glucokinase-like ROK family protein